MTPKKHKTRDVSRDPRGTATQWIKECESKKAALYDRASKYDAVFINTPRDWTR